MSDEAELARRFPTMSSENRTQPGVRDEALRDRYPSMVAEVRRFERASPGPGAATEDQRLQARYPSMKAEEPATSRYQPMRPDARPVRDFDTEWQLRERYPSTLETDAQPYVGAGASEEARLVARYPAMSSVERGEPSPTPASRVPAGETQAPPNADTAKPSPGPGDAYEVKLPDGYVTDRAQLDGFTKVAREAGVSAEQASKIAAHHIEQVDAELEAQDQSWAKESRADAEFGGARYEATSADARRALDAFGPELMEEIRVLHLQDWPPLRRFLVRVGQALG